MSKVKTSGSLWSPMPTIPQRSIKRPISTTTKPSTTSTKYEPPRIDEYSSQGEVVEEDTGAETSENESIDEQTGSELEMEQPVSGMVFEQRGRTQLENLQISMYNVTKQHAYDSFEKCFPSFKFKTSFKNANWYRI